MQKNRRANSKKINRKKINNPAVGAEQRGARGPAGRGTFGSDPIARALTPQASHVTLTRHAVGLVVVFIKRPCSLALLLRPSHHHHCHLPFLLALAESPSGFPSREEKMSDEGTANCIDIILAIILPPLGVFFKFACGVSGSADPVFLS
jgi:hypothetical protein